MKKRILALLLAAVLLTNTVPVSVLAEQAPVAPAEVSADPSAESPAGPGTEVMPMDEPEVEPEPQPEPCGTCGVVGCTSEHLNWCDACKRDDCGVDHTVVVEPCSICKQENCTTQHEKCPVCPNYDCTVEHVYCKACLRWDCGKDHTRTVKAEDVIGRVATLTKGATLFLWAEPFSTSNQTLTGASSLPAYVRVVDVQTYGESTVLYKLEAADGSGWPSYYEGFCYLDSENVHFVENYCETCHTVDCGKSHVWCETCKKYDCGVNHTPPVIGCGCCENCIGVEDCDCNCVDCDFYEEPVLPDVPSEPSWGEDPYPELPSLYHPENEVAVYAEELPVGTSLVVEEADVTAQLRAFGVPASKLVFGLDISLDGYQTEALVKVAVSERPGTLIGILHTHGSKTTYIGTAEVLSDGTVEFVTDGFSEFAGFTVDFHYNGVDFSIDGMTSILLSELFEEMGIDEDAYDATAVVFSDPTLVEVTEEGDDWRLTSLKAFLTEETLIVTFSDGRTIVVDVTDAVTDVEYKGTTEYNAPSNAGDDLVIWIDHDKLPVTFTLTGTRRYWYENGDGSSDAHVEVSDKSDQQKLTVKVKNSAPVGYKFGIKNSGWGNAISAFQCGRVFFRVVEFVTFDYVENTVTTPTVFPRDSANDEIIGRWGIANTQPDTKDRVRVTTIPSTNPKAPGYEFVDWTFKNYLGNTQHANPGDEIWLDEDSISDEDFIYFNANWNKISYTITYDENGGSSVADQAYNVETNLTLREAPKREGYNFKGWKLSTKTESWAAETYSAGQNMGQANYGNITLVAQWEIISSAVTYEYTGTHYPNIPALPDTKYYDYNTSVSVEPAPTLTGYTFSGWTTFDATVNGGKFTMPNKVVTFSGYWTANRYGLTFHYNGGKNSETGKSDDVTYTATYGWQDYYGVGGLYPAREGYTFNGWYTESAAGDQIYDSNNICIPGTQYWDSTNHWIGTDDADFYAHWTVNSHKVTYSYTGDVPDGADPVPVVSGKVNYGTEVTVAGSPAAIEGYTFSGWSVSGASVTNGKFSMPDNDVTITGNWTVTPIEVSYTVNHWQQKVGGIGYTLKEKEELTAPPNSSVTPAVETYTGFKKPQAQTVTVSADGSTVVDYYYDRNSFTVTLNKGTGIASVTGAGSYLYEAPVTVNATLLAGYEWDSWSGTGAASAQEHSFAMPAGNREWTATAKAKTYTVTLNPNGGTVSPTSKSVTYNSIYGELPMPERTGYTFDGWFTEASDGTKVEANTVYTTAGNSTIYAQWTAIEYPIVYDLDGGTVDPANYTAYTIESASFTLHNPVKTGYDFAGWTGTELETATETVEIKTGSTGDRSYTATWTPITYTVQFNKKADAAIGTMAELTATYDTETKLTANAFTREGYTFKGWAKAENGDVAYEDKAAVLNWANAQGAVIPLYAVWERNTISLTITTNQNASKGTFDTNQNYLFDVEGWPVETDLSKPATIKLTVVLGAQDSQTIVGLPAGNYVVSDRQAWSWRYAHKATAQFACTGPDAKNNCPFQYLKTEILSDKIYWLNGYNYGIWKDEKTKGGGKR